MYEILDKIDSPSELKTLSGKEVLQLNKDIREFLIENVTKTGGHLASNLGAVELSVALHRVFDTPKDRIIFDVGHQSYVHKILTGRKGGFANLRHENGLSGFTKRTESEYDCFGAGHSSTAISAALGFAEADRLCGRDNYTIAVVGDGAFTGGMVYEALNNCRKDLKLIIILNENEMSISKNVGNLSRHISKLRATKGYHRFKRSLSRTFDCIPLVGKPLKNGTSYIKSKLKSAVYNLNFFENMGLKYMGPIDGNDYYSVEYILEQAKKRNQSVLVHVKTIKGYGYDKAVLDPEQYHGISGCDSVKSSNGSFSINMGKNLCALAEKNEKICAITAAMCGGTGLESFEKQFPERIFDVGIAESHAVTFFAGLSAAGMKPCFAVYSTFLQRAYDNILHDVALQNLGGVFLIDRSGFAPEDGATHHGIYDVAFLSQVEGITIYSPVSYKAFYSMMERATESDGLYAIRYPKGGENEELKNAFGVDSSDNSFMPLMCGTDENGKLPSSFVVTYGRITDEALQARALLAQKGIDIGIVLLQTLKPLENQIDIIISAMNNENGKVVFLEEGVQQGSVAMILHSMLCEKGALDNKKCKILALNGEIPEQAPLCHTYEKCGISHKDIISFVTEE